VSVLRASGAASSFHRDNRPIAIEGDSESPISAGHLCPKGAASHDLVTHPNRLTRVKYRAPHAASWQEIELGTAMDMIADRVWASRERAFVEEVDGKPLMQLRTVAHLGGATLDNEENYLIKKLRRRPRHGRDHQSGPDMT
jgi:formate dehydrogenase major subunit